MPFDFGSMSDVKATDQGEAIATTKFDFSTAEDMPQVNPAPAQRVSVLSRIARAVIKTSPLEQFKTSMYLQQHMPDINPSDDFMTSLKKVNDVLEPREQEIMQQGIGKTLEGPMQTAVGVGLAVAPIQTVIGVGAFTALDHVFNLRHLVEEKFPDTSPEIKDIVELADFAIKGGIIGKGMHSDKSFFKKRMDTLGMPRNVNVNPEAIHTVKQSGNLMPEEKLDMMKTLGIEDAHVNASLSGNVPINIPVSKVMALAEKPYWDIAAHELLAKASSTPDLVQASLDLQPIMRNIKSMQSEKKLSTMTTSQLKKAVGIDNLKNANFVQLKSLEKFMGDLKEGDHFLSSEQVKSLSGIIKELPSPEITPKRIVLEKFGEKEEILSEGMMSKTDPNLIPTVDIKKGHPLVKKVVENASEKMMEAEKVINERNKVFDGLLKKAEKARDKLLPLGEKASRFLAPQNKEIFQALSGEKVPLTGEEKIVVEHLKDFFKSAKEDLSLKKYRRQYVTHIEKPLMEKIVTKGLFPAIKEILSGQKKGSIPIEILRELENIIGSEKFFKYALERKGGVDPTTDIRRIFSDYSSLLETKKALDQILPEGQAVTKNLLQGKSSLWMKQFLQNLKGRGLDFSFRNGPMAWLAKTADAIVDIGYLKLLGGNVKSALKNVVAGEANSWIYQDFPTYLKGKERLITNPKKAYALATEYGALEGTYSDFAQKGIGVLKKGQDVLMMFQKWGEIEVRASIFSSMLTEKEWKTGVLSQERFNEIKDVIAITQGVFSKWDSPLLLQTWYGRMFFQMNRWRITNAMLLKSIVSDAATDVKAGKFNTRNTTRLGKTLIAYGAGMYISYQLAQAGFKMASDVTRNMAQTTDGVLSLFTKGELVTMFTKNPSLDFLQDVSDSVQNLSNYLHVPGVKKARGKGIQDTYIAPIQALEDISDAVESFS